MSASVLKGNSNHVLGILITCRSSPVSISIIASILPAVVAPHRVVTPHVLPAVALSRGLTALVDI